MEVGEVIQFYDSDRRFPAWGFGGRINGTISHCFNLNGSASGIEVRRLLRFFQFVLYTTSNKKDIFHLSLQFIIMKALIFFQVVISASYFSHHLVNLLCYSFFARFWYLVNFLNRKENNMFY